MSPAKITGTESSCKVPNIFAPF